MMEGISAPKNRKPAKSESEPSVENRTSFCAMPIPTVRPSRPELSAGRNLAIAIGDNLWANGSPLRYYIYEKDEPIVYKNGDRDTASFTITNRHRDPIASAFATWADTGMGTHFERVSSAEEAEVRILICYPSVRYSSSLLGRREHLSRENARPSRPTMTLNWGRHPPRNALNTALHEIGHVLGLEHAHKHPDSPLQMEEDTVLDHYLSIIDDEDLIRHNLLTPIPREGAIFSDWDADSIMQYEIPAEVIDSPPPYSTDGIRPRGGLSSTDKRWIRDLYPPQSARHYRNLQISQSKKLNVAAGNQASFLFEPPFSRTHRCELFGGGDCVMAIFEETDDGGLHFRAVADDSGEDDNGALDYRFLRNHKYVIRVMMHYRYSAAEPAIMIS